MRKKLGKESQFGSKGVTAMNKNAIQKFAIWARNELIAQVSQRAYQYGVTKDGYGEQNAVTVGGRALTTDEQRQRK